MPSLSIAHAKSIYFRNKMMNVYIKQILSKQLIRKQVKRKKSCFKIKKKN